MATAVRVLVFALWGAIGVGTVQVHAHKVDHPVTIVQSVEVANK